MKNQMEPIISANSHSQLKDISLPFKRCAKNSIKSNYKSNKYKSKTIKISLKFATVNSPKILKQDMT